MRGRQAVSLQATASSPRKRGPIVPTMDSRLRGNDVTFGRAEGEEGTASLVFCFALLN